MARRGSETRRLPAEVLVRLTDEQKTAVAMHVQAAQVSIATWVRRIIADAIGVEPGPVTRRAVPPQEILEIAHLREVVAELGGALVKAVIAAREGGRPVEHAAIEALIPGIKAAVLDLDRLKEKLWRPAA
jgi:transposase-like protein